MKTGSGLDNPLASQGDDDGGRHEWGHIHSHTHTKEKKGKEIKGKATKGKEESIELCADCCCSKCVSAAGRSFPCAAALAVNVHSPAVHARASCCCSCSQCAQSRNSCESQLLLLLQSMCTVLLLHSVILLFSLSLSLSLSAIIHFDSLHNAIFLMSVKKIATMLRCPFFYIDCFH